jgi:RluA family pseudouridine synthase
MTRIDPDQMTIMADEDLLVIDKPAGLLTLQHGYQPSQPFLLNLLMDRFGPLWVVHRLDRDTSGVILFARTAAAHRALNTQFERRQIIKKYHALIVGTPGWSSKTIALSLRLDGDRLHRTVVDPRAGKECITAIRLLDRYNHYALVEAQPKTGRRHQIRVHLAAVGHPIVVDDLYGDGLALWLSALKPGYKPGNQTEKPLFGRLGLHASELTLTHPRNGQRVVVQAPYPKDFQRAIKQLRKYDR